MYNEEEDKIEHLSPLLLHAAGVYTSLVLSPCPCLLVQWMAGVGRSIKAETKTIV